MTAVHTKTCMYILAGRWKIKIKLHTVLSLQACRRYCDFIYSMCLCVCVYSQPPLCWMSWTGRKNWKKCSERTGRMTPRFSGRCLVALQAWHATIQVNKSSKANKRWVCLCPTFIPSCLYICLHYTDALCAFTSPWNRRFAHQPIITWLTWERACGF